MNVDRKSAIRNSLQTVARPDFAYSLILFLLAGAALTLALRQGVQMPAQFGWGSVLFFLLFGLFTITMGYPRPNNGYVSFDRVAQVSSILLLGPIAAAWINGLASLIYPLHRIWNGHSLRDVLTASLHNSGMVVVAILVCGSLYAYLGGPVPLLRLDLTAAGLLLLLTLSMQLVMDLSMMTLLYLRKADPSKLHSVFSTGIEFASVLIAVLVALIYVRLDVTVTGLLLVVLGLGMLVLKQFANMRHKLEGLVDERTEELRIKTLELERQATHDKLTGLFNRRFADDYLHREIEAAKRHGRPFTVALADIDHFKQINDQHSHAVGDAVLRSVAELLVARCRNTDVVARYGGEEFLLCFPDTEAGFAEQICNELGTAVENADWSSFATGNGRHMQITVSFGIAELGRDPRRTTILAAADTRLYQAKRKGRNRVVA